MKNSVLSLFLATLSVACAAQELAITFDDLPRNGDLPPGVTQLETTKAVIAMLKKRHVPPVYGFINGRKLEGSPDGAQALEFWAANEPVGNHTYSHIDLEQNTAEAFEHDIELNEPALELLQPNADAWHWLRYPFLREGDTQEKRRAVRAYLKAHGYRIAQVTIDWQDYLWNFAYSHCASKGDSKSLDWLRSSYLSAASASLDYGRAQAKLIYGRDINYVLLMHLGAYSSTILPDAIDLLRKKGFQLVTLDEAEKDPAYESDPDIGMKDPGTLLYQMMQARRLNLDGALSPQIPEKELETICQ